MFFENDILYVVIGGFYGAEFKLTDPNTWKFTVHPILESGPHPRETFMAKNAPKMPILLKTTFFGP